MSQCEGGAYSGEERSEWECPHCGAVHGYTYRERHMTRLRVVLNGVRASWAGDGDYDCPNCGGVVTWCASAAALSRLMRNRIGRIE